MLAFILYNEQDKGSNPLSIITWSVLEKQNVQAKKVYWIYTHIQDKSIKLPFETKDSKHLVGTNMVTIRQL